MSTKFFTNEDKNTLLNKFSGIFTYNKDIQFFDALVGFLRASGYFSIRPYLESVPYIRILVGINVDGIIANFHKKGLVFLADSGIAVNEFKKDILSDIQSAGYSAKVEQGIFQFIQDVMDKKLEIRAHPSKRLHAKIYIFRPEGFNEHKPGAVITGSSNLTDAGLGATEENRNYEFNVLSHDYEDINFATSEFEKLWKEGVAVLPQDLKEIQEKSFLNKDYTPFEVYIKFLMEYFGESIEYDPNAIADLPSGFKRLSYQVDAVSQGYELLRKHNGFFLADVVGLGKTIIAILITKKFFYHNDFPSYLSEILIVVPPALKESWQETIDKFGLKTAHILTNGSLHKVKDPKKYDLIVVDEAHGFRNDTAEAYSQLQRICKTATRHRLKDGSFAKKKVILVSATPLNNRPEDIRNLIYLFQDGKDSTLEIANLQRFFAARIKEYKEALKDPSTEKARLKVKKIYEKIRTKVVADITIRRTRTDLQGHAQYKKDLDGQGIVFPRVEKPRKIFYQLDPVLDELYDKTIRLLSHPQEGLTYNRYRAIGFLKPDKKVKYHNADLISGQLARIMKTLLVKRIDSSFYAFKNSLKRFQRATKAMISMFNKGSIYIAPNLNVTEYIIEDREEELINKIIELQDDDLTISVCKPDDFEYGYLDGILHDDKILTELVQAWENVSNDPKLDEFKDRLKGNLLDPAINHGEKLVIFSESKETTNYLTEELTKLSYKNILTVHSGNRREKTQDIKANFDANIPLAEQKDDYKILISTEVLSEGINLHRSNIIVNYDTPWNSTRLMQRIGRINRIGTTAPSIYIFNFFPTTKVNNDIELEKKAIMKLQAFHTALGEDSQIYSTEEEYESFGLYDSEVQEERDERLAYLMLLRTFKTDSPELFRKIKNMPLRARVGRKDKTKDKTTITFIRNKRRDAFYFIEATKKIEEFSFVEMANAYQANAQEKPIELHDQHHEQVNIAVNDFKEKIQAEAVQHRIVDITQGPNEQKALKFLDAFTKLNFVADHEIELIKAAKHAIKMAKFQNLQREINKIQKSQKKVSIKPVLLLEKVIEILNKYPLQTDENNDENTLITVREHLDLEPEIIISQSYSGATHS
ncbi:helicase-related protein [Fibrobacterota bacterium]